MSPLKINVLLVLFVLQIIIAVTLAIWISHFVCEWKQLWMQLISMRSEHENIYLKIFFFLNHTVKEEIHTTHGWVPHHDRWG